MAENPNNLDIFSDGEQHVHYKEPVSNRDNLSSMFSKVEKGKVVRTAEVQELTDDDADSLEYGESKSQKMKRLSTQGGMPQRLNFVKVQNLPRLKKSQKKEKASFNSLYKQEMLQKSKEAKTDILEAIDKIQAGQGVNEQIQLK